MLYEKLSSLEFDVEGYRLEPLMLAAGRGWTRRTTVVRLVGGGCEGAGEDVTYANPDQGRFQREGGGLPLAGRYTLESFSRRLDGLELFPAPPADPSARPFRRWAFESAALDLALRQHGASLAARLGREPHPVRFLVSMGLGDPPSTHRLRALLAHDGRLRFKLDWSPGWTDATLDELAALDAVEVVDFKGRYHGAFRGPEADPEGYRRVAEALPAARLEDPDWTAAVAAALAAHRDRVTWDAPVHAAADLDRLPFPPRGLNIKPSRFGLLSELLRVYERCEADGIAAYGGGQFELGPGRGQIQLLAALFHPDAPNDVAPVAYHRSAIGPELPASPLAPDPRATGFAREDPGPPAGLA